MKWAISILLFLACIGVSAQSKMKLAAMQQGAGPGVIYDGQNAADPVNEVNGVANTQDSANATWSSDTGTGVTNGTYCLVVTHGTTGTGSTSRIQTQNIEIGDEIQVVMDVNKRSGTNVTIVLATADGWDVQDTGTVNSENGVTRTATATASNPDIRVVYGSGASTGSSHGIDNIVLTKLN
ncbi:hypothetical protein [Robiginitalea biformata]|uniref:Uncharacterized protein n=1 Tax=Robiginitalea biformata (strain ATCC BAA-864 / DSM 15991 / KCTC 12146 / HTCC2501) TaxID=313596 RepID=A4CKP7_ROBBH|nr:hypothetical protein [Robiginitalea biformata]EAR15446.1 hypothetical protein RB2501_13999 [Robiginitalea biformata HTCC2501]